jgi:predicted nucleic acid-binding protein
MAASWDRVVCNTGPIVGLHRIGQLELLTRLIPEIMVPAVIVDELQAGMSAEDGALQRWLQAVTVCEPTAPIDPLLTAELDAGEAAVIALARELSMPILMDERKGRKVAVLAFNLAVFGTGRILVEAKRHGFIDHVRPAMEQMRAAGYFLSERLVLYVAREAGE